MNEYLELIEKLENGTITQSEFLTALNLFKYVISNPEATSISGMPWDNPQLVEYPEGSGRYISKGLVPGKVKGTPAAYTKWLEENAYSKAQIDDSVEKVKNPDKSVPAEYLQWLEEEGYKESEQNLVIDETRTPTTTSTTTSTGGKGGGGTKTGTESATEATTDPATKTVGDALTGELIIDSTDFDNLTDAFTKYMDTAQGQRMMKDRKISMEVNRIAPRLKEGLKVGLGIYDMFLSGDQIRRSNEELKKLKRPPLPSTVKDQFLKDRLTEAQKDEATAGLEQKIAAC
jgi:hypothetical protein